MAETEDGAETSLVFGGVAVGRATALKHLRDAAEHEMLCGKCINGTVSRERVDS